MRSPTWVAELVTMTEGALYQKLSTGHNNLLMVQRIGRNGFKGMQPVYTYFIKRSTRTDTFSNIAYWGSFILSLSKRNMQRPIFTLEKHCIAPAAYYTDTDSFFMLEKNVKYIKEEHMGSALGAFSSDIKVPSSLSKKEIKITRSPTICFAIFCGKKVYMNVIATEYETEQGGARFTRFTLVTKMKGIPRESILKAAAERFGPGMRGVCRLYQTLYAGKGVTFDLCAGSALGTKLQVDQSSQRYKAISEFTRTVRCSV